MTSCSRLEANRCADRISERFPDQPKRKVISHSREKLANAASQGKLDWIGMSNEKGQGEHIFTSSRVCEKWRQEGIITRVK